VRAVADRAFPEKSKYMSKKILQGTIVSTATPHTVVVEVSRILKHPKYRKRIRKSKHYKARAAGQNLAVGDTVLIEESRPLSRDTRWVVKEKIVHVSTSRAEVRTEEPTL
jgi:small subunit ribosomal protein S17